MSRRIRCEDPAVVYHISNVVDQRMYLLRPDDELNKHVMYWLRKAVRIYGIRLYAAVVMCNHFHLIAQAPKGNMSQFMCYFQTNLSREVNVLRGRKGASLFPERYSSEPILDEASFKDLLCYVLVNPVKANLVEFPRQFPGYTSWHQHVGQCQPSRHREEPPKIEKPPFWDGLSNEELAAEWRELVRPSVIEFARARTKSVVGAQRLRKLNFFKKPRRPSQSRSKWKPLCHAKDFASWKRFARFFSEIQREYRAASAAWREGRIAEFPFGTFPPGWSSCVSEGERRFPPDFRIGHREPLRVAA